MKSTFIITTYILIQLFHQFSTQSIVEEQTKIDNLTSNYVVRLKFYLKEEQVPEFIVETLNRTDANITTGDIIQLGKIDRLSLEQFKRIINYYNLTIDQVWNVDNLEEIFQLTGTSFNLFYYNLTNSLNITGANLANTLNLLNVDTGRFFTALGLNLDIFEILRNGTYNRTNIDNILATINRTSDQIFNTTRTFIASNIIQLNRTYFIETLSKNYGFNRVKFLQFWSILNITTRHVYDVENFRSILDGKLTDLNQIVIPGTIIDRNRLLIHRQLYEYLQSDFSQFRFTTNNNLEIVGLDRAITTNVVQLKLKDSIDVFTRKPNRIVSNNCTFVGIDNETIIVDYLVVNVTNSSVIGYKNLATKFQLGAPLICANRELYGLAVGEDEESIRFESIGKFTSNNGSIILLFTPILIVQFLLTIF